MAVHVTRHNAGEILFCSVNTFWKHKDLPCEYIYLKPCVLQSSIYAWSQSAAPVIQQLSCGTEDDVEDESLDGDNMENGEKIDS